MLCGARRPEWRRVMLLCGAVAACSPQVATQPASEQPPTRRGMGPPDQNEPPEYWWEAADDAASAEIRLERLQAAMPRCLEEFETFAANPAPHDLSEVAGRERRCNLNPRLQRGGLCDASVWMSVGAARCVADATGFDLDWDVLVAGLIIKDVVFWQFLYPGGPSCSDRQIFRMNANTGEMTVQELLVDCVV